MDTSKTCGQESEVFGAIFTYDPVSGLNDFILVYNEKTGDLVLKMHGDNPVRMNGSLKGLIFICVQNSRSEHCILTDDAVVLWQNNHGAQVQ